MQKFKSIDVKKKGAKHTIKVVYNKDEVSKDRDVWAAEYSKKTNQYLSVALQTSLDGLIPHLLWSTELISDDLKLDKDLDYPTYFKDHKFREDERFDSIEITKIVFFGKEKLDAVKLFGFKRTTKCSKGFNVKIETPQINLDRESQDYALLTILDEQLSDLMVELEAYLEEGASLNKAQQMALFEQVEAEQD